MSLLKRPFSRRILLNVILVLTVVAIFVTDFDVVKADGVTYHIDSVAGSDTNDGLSPDTPWKTIDQLNTAMNKSLIHAGDTVVFKKGMIFNGRVLVTVSGTSGSNINFNSYDDGERPIINASGYQSGVSFSNRSFITMNDLKITGASTRAIDVSNNASDLTFSNMELDTAATGISLTTGNLTNIFIDNLKTEVTSVPVNIFGFSSLRGLKIDRSELNNGKIYGLRINNTTGICSDVSINNTHLNRNGSRGVSINSCDDIRIDDTEVSENKIFGLELIGNINGLHINGLIADQNANKGLYTTTMTGQRIKHVVIKNSQFNNNGSNGLSLAGTGDGADIINVEASFNHGDGFNIHDSWKNVEIDNSKADENGDIRVSTSGDGYTFHDNSTGKITNSTAYNNLKSAVANVGNSSVVMKNNIFSHPTNGSIPLVELLGTGRFDMYNNTIFSPAHVGIGLEVDGGATLTAKNNIINGFNIGFSMTSGTATDDYNNVYGATMSNWSGVTKGEHSFDSDPLFTDPNSFDLTLQGDSPNIDKGTSETGVPTKDFLGQRRFDNPDVPNFGGGYLPYYDIGSYERTKP